MPTSIRERIALEAHFWPSHDPEDEGAISLCQSITGRVLPARWAILESSTPMGIPKDSIAAQLLDLSQAIAEDRLGDDGTNT